MRDIDRRTFLVTSGLALAWLATGCGGDEKLPEDASLDELVEALRKREGDSINVIQAVDQILVAPASRVAFALIGGADNTTRYTGGDVQVYWGINSAASAFGPVRAAYHGEGLGDKGIYIVRLDIDRPGNWNVLAVGKPRGASKEVWGAAAYPAVERVDGPGTGAKALSVPTPTVDNHRGVEPYCTRTPPCSMHRMSLDVALANGRPTVFNIGTPRFCSSKVCGPVVDVIQTVSTQFADRVNFIHAEVYTNDTNAPAKGVNGFTPTMKAWRQQQEPVTYWIRPDRTITERIVGPTDVAEVRALTQALLG
jgi:hypothetical protein